MNAGLIVIILLLVLSILGIPIYLALGIGTLVALNMADMPFIVLPQKLFAAHCWQSRSLCWQGILCLAVLQGS
jgi:predicted histidine transporter YuiF (NhaC family)